MKRLFLGFIVLLMSFSISGCFKKDTMENIDIQTTVYPIEYITSMLYEDNAKIYSIYPDDIDVNQYNLTDKQLTDYSKSGLFIYNGLSKEKNYAIKMLNKNKKLKIIDAAMAIEYEYGNEELWLDPSNFLMLAQNIKNGFKEYITNPYLKNEIDDNYEDLKIKISEVDADLKLVAENAGNKTIVVANDVFLFLEKYGYNVISLEDNDNLTDKKIADVKALINSGTIKYVFTKPNEEVNKTIQGLIDTYKISTLELNTANNLTDDEREEKVDFIQIMNNNIDLLKRELYQ
jgi:zinc transport system substrate-binding protein